MQPNETTQTGGDTVPRVLQLHLTKLEQYVLHHANDTFEKMAADLNRTPGTMGRAYDRLRKAEKRAEARGFVIAPTVGGGYTLIASKHFSPSDALD